MAKLGKRFKTAAQNVDRNKLYELAEAVKLVKENAKAKFNETIEIALNLGVDPRHAGQLVRGVCQLPHGTGKTMRVAVFARGEKAEEAKKAGADLVGAEELAAEIEKGVINFDRCIATPDMMGVAGKVAKVLGPRGLMPNPKLGTVTMDVKKAVESAKAGELQYRVEKTGIVHAGVGKASFTEKQLVENIQMFLDTIAKSRPSGVKGKFMLRCTISSTMGPGVKVSLVSE